MHESPVPLLKGQRPMEFWVLSGVFDQGWSKTPREVWPSGTRLDFPALTHKTNLYPPPSITFWSPPVVDCFVLYSLSLIIKMKSIFQESSNVACFVPWICKLVSASSQSDQLGLLFDVIGYKQGRFQNTILDLLLVNWNWQMNLHMICLMLHSHQPR